MSQSRIEQTGKHESFYAVHDSGKVTLTCNCKNCNGREVDLTIPIKCFTDLNEAKIAPAIDGLGVITHLVLCVIWFRWVQTKDGYEKTNLRKDFLGIGGDYLNQMLNELLRAGRIAVGSCGCCYAPTELVSAYGANDER
jgi:hypothetical protein